MCLASFLLLLLLNPALLEVVFHLFLPAVATRCNTDVGECNVQTQHLHVFALADQLLSHVKVLFFFYLMLTDIFVDSIFYRLRDSLTTSMWTQTPGKTASMNVFTLKPSPRRLTTAE